MSLDLLLLILIGLCLVLLGFVISNFIIKVKSRKFAKNFTGKLKELLDENRSSNKE